MTSMRPQGRVDGLVREFYPGDLMVLGEAINAGVLSQTATAFSIPAAQIATGILVIKSTGAVAAATGTLDSASNILAAIAGVQSPSDLVPGNTFRLDILNLLTAQLTIALSSGVLAGTVNSANLLTISAGYNREYLATVINNQPACAFNMTYTSGTALSFVLLPNQTAIGINSRDYGNFPTPGMTITNAPTGITAAGIYVTGLVMGQGGITGVNISTIPTTASAVAGTQVQFAPQILLDTIGAKVA